jgi:hypothetical protein
LLIPASTRIAFGLEVRAVDLHAWVRIDESYKA